MRANRVLKFAVAYALAAASSMAVAQTPPAEGSVTELETVIVTGTYIRGTAEDAALPVDVISTEDLEKQGSPTMVDLVKSIPAVQAIVGESNQFGVAAGAGTSNINLRGLGGTRTLVLLNGRRLASSTTGQGVDTNLLPSAAIGRIEVLKDGAAATYGSDAIGGVVNFITKENFEGVSIDGSYSYIDGSDGDYSGNIAFGWQGDMSSVLLAVGYRHRSELSTLARDWAVRSRDENPQGGWSNAGTAANFTTLASTTPTGSIADPACSAIGGVPVSGCQFQYIVFDNLVEEEDHYNAFAQYELEISSAFKIHAEALWAMHDVPRERVSPSYGPNQGPAGGAPSYFVPLGNPGLQSLLPFLSGPNQTLVNGSTYLNPGATGSGTAQPGVVVSGLSWRPLAQAGNPTGDKSQFNSRKFDGFRASIGLSGDVGDTMNWNVGATYGENSAELATPDFLVSRLQLALRGLGGPNCASTALPGDPGCLWLNPFSTGVPGNVATGLINTVTNVGPYNSAELVRWLTTPNSAEDTSSILAVDAVLAGELPFLNLPGGAIGWALGAQYRENGYERVVTDPFADISRNPCAQSPVNPAATCTAQNGAMSFYGPLVATDVTQDVISGFTELSLPILDSLQAQIAVRYEDYGDPVGSTTNPKLSVRYQPLDMLTFRASAGTTFRAPPQTSIGTASATTLAFAYGSYRAFDTFQNPNLKPEKAKTLNAGIIVKVAGLSATIDYWRFKFEDQLTVESGANLLNVFFGAGGTGRCGDPAFAGLQARFTFSGACNSANIQRVRLNQINALSDIDVDGIDANIYYVFDVASSELRIGAEATYNLNYELGESRVEGILLEDPVDGVGTRGGRAGTQIQWKGSAYIDLGLDDHNVRWTTRYVDGLTDARGAATFGTNTLGKQIGSYLTHDLTYVVNLPGSVTVNASVINLTDEDPPFVRLDLSYEPFVANPLGRYYKFGVGVKF